jgi:hypothetical protein
MRHRIAVAVLALALATSTFADQRAQNGGAQAGATGVTPITVSQNSDGKIRIAIRENKAVISQSRMGELSAEIGKSCSPNAIISLDPNKSDFTLDFYRNENARNNAMAFGFMNRGLLGGLAMAAVASTLQVNSATLSDSASDVIWTGKSNTVHDVIAQACKFIVLQAPLAVVAPTPAVAITVAAPVAAAVAQEDAAPATTQSVSFASAPANADLTIDNAFVGSTPSTLSLTFGSHVIQMAKDGYTTWTRTVTIGAGDSVHFVGTLTPIQSGEYQAPAPKH